MEAGAAAGTEEGVPPAEAQLPSFTHVHRSLTLVSARQARKSDGVFGRTAVCKSVVMRGGVHTCDFTVLKGRKVVVGVCKSSYDPSRGPRATHGRDGWGCHTLGGDFCHSLADGTQAWPKWPGQAGVREGDKLGLRLDLTRPDHGRIEVFKNDARLGTMVTTPELVGQELCWMVEIEGPGDAVRVGPPVDVLDGLRHGGARWPAIGGAPPRRPAPRRRLDNNGRLARRQLGLPPASPAPMPAVDPTTARLAETHPHWVCPITGELMVDPVRDHEGHSWEREAVVRWLELSQTSPLTRSPRAPPLPFTFTFVFPPYTTFSSAELGPLTIAALLYIHVQSGCRI